MKKEQNSLDKAGNFPEKQSKSHTPIDIDYEPLLKKFIHPTITPHSPAKISLTGQLISQKPTFLIISDHEETRRIIVGKINALGAQCAEAPFQKALDNYRFCELDNVILLFDLRLLPASGNVPVLQKIEDQFSNVPLIIIDSQERPQNEVDIIARISTFRLRSVDDSQFTNAIRTAFHVKKLIYENNLIKQSISFPHNIFRPSGKSDHIDILNRTINEISMLETPVVIPGEQGTQKHYLAQQIHLNSVRANYPFDIVSLYLLPPESAGVNLFGCISALDARYPYGVIGKLELIHRGTVFIDYIEYLEPNEQEQLLQFLKTKAFYKKGSTQIVFSNVRVIAAYYNNLRHDVEIGIFNEELYDLLHATVLYSPPLREFKSALPEYVRLGISWAAVSNNLPVPKVDKSAIDKMVNYTWPHNVKEFEVVIRRAVFMDKDGVITSDDIQFDLNPPDKNSTNHTPSHDIGLAGLTMREIQKRAIEETLKFNKGNKLASSRMLGVSEKTLYNKLKALGITSD